MTFFLPIFYKHVLNWRNIWMESQLERVRLARSEALSDLRDFNVMLSVCESRSRPKTSCADGFGCSHEVHHVRL